MSYRACIFDLDGTLCDSVESIAWSGNHMLADLGMRQASLEDYKIFVGDGVDVLMRRLLRFGGDSGSVHFEEAKRLYTGYFKEGCLYNVKAYPGIPEVLARLKEQGAKLAVLSNKPHENTVNVIEKVFGPDLFDLVLIKLILAKKVQDIITDPFHHGKDNLFHAFCTLVALYQLTYFRNL